MEVINEPVQNAVQCTRRRRSTGISLTYHLTFYHSPVLEMALSSNVIINGSTINSVQGDFHIHNKDLESGMLNFKSIKKNLLIDNPMKDLIPY